MGGHTRFLRASAGALLVMVGVVGIQGPGSPPASAAPSGCGGYQFADSYDGAPDDPGVYDYQLNSRLERRQTGGGAQATYTRRSGYAASSAQPPPSYVQVNQAVSEPNKLSLWKGPAGDTYAYPTYAAVRLDTAVAPSPDPLASTYTVKAKVDPLRGETTSSNWVSLILAASRTGNGSVTATDVSAGLLIRSNGGLSVYQGGVAKLTTSVPAAPDYDVTFSVNRTNKVVTVTVNGEERTANLTSALPTMAYLFIGSYTGHTTTASSPRSSVDDLCVQHMYGFTDSFNSASSPSSTNDYLLNGTPVNESTGSSDLDSRQQLASQMSYTRTLGAADGSRVNATDTGWSAPSVLSFRGSNGAVRLDSPIAADPESNIFRIHARIDPVRGDTTTADWVSLVLSENKNSTGWVTNGDVDFAFYLRSDGRFHVVQGGTPMVVTPDPTLVRPPSNPDGSYDVTAMVSSGTTPTATFVFDGSSAQTYTAVLTQAIAPLSYLYAGNSLSQANIDLKRPSSIDDLRVNRITKYYGYYGAVWPNPIPDAAENNLHATYASAEGKAADYNLNVIKLTTPTPYNSAYQAAVDDILADCRIAGCVVDVGTVLFHDTDPSTAGRAYRLWADAGSPDYIDRWNAFTEYLVNAQDTDGTPGLDHVMGFDILDEPYRLNALYSQLDTAVKLVKCVSSTASVCGTSAAQTFRTTAALLEFDSGNMPVVWSSTASSEKIPPDVDIVGFTYYCPGDPDFALEPQRDGIDNNLELLTTARSRPSQRLIMFPEARTGKNCARKYDDTRHGDVYFSSTQREYNEIMMAPGVTAEPNNPEEKAVRNGSRPAAAGVITFGLWLAFDCDDPELEQAIPDADCPDEPYDYIMLTPETLTSTWATMHQIGRSIALRGNT